MEFHHCMPANSSAVGLRSLSVASSRLRHLVGVYRRISRWEHEAVLEATEKRLERTPEPARIRTQTVEHVFGTQKSWMGATHFLMKRLPNARTEMSLHVLAYNLRRAMQIFGVVPLMRAMRA